MVVVSNHGRELPEISNHGIFLKAPAFEGNFDPEEIWYKGLNPWKRLNSHYTYASVRRNANFIPFRRMRDHLDFVLTTTYQHNEELFPEKIDVVLQPQTISKKKTGKAGVEWDTAHHIEKADLFSTDCALKSEKLCPGHPVLIGGLKKRAHPSSIKLMNSSHHSPQTNAGYIRQDRDGNLFQY